MTIEFKSLSPRAVIQASLGPQQDAALAFAPQGDERSMMRAMLDRYSMWVHRCVQLNAEVAANVPFKLLSLKAKPLGQEVAYGRALRPLSLETKAYLQGKAKVKPSSTVRKAMRQGLEDAVELESHPVLDLLNDINDWTDGYQFRIALYSDRQIFGRAFVHLVGQPLPTELWRMEPYLTKVIPDPSKFVRAFEYGDDPNKVRFTPEEVLWFRMYDPCNPWGGVGPLEAWLKTVDASMAIQSYQDWLFKRGGAPDYVVRSDVAPTQDQKNQFTSEWQRLFGPLYWRKRNIAFVSGAGADLVKLGQTNKELDFVESANAIRDQIGQAFGVPKSKLTTDDVNRANADSTDEMHIRDTVWPMVQQVEDLLNERLVSLYGEGLYLCHENPIPEDKTIRIAERASKLASGYTINQLMEEDGQESVPMAEADMPLIGQGFQPLETLRIAQEQAEAQLEATQQATEMAAEDPAAQAPPDQPAKAIAELTIKVQALAEGLEGQLSTMVDKVQTAADEPMKAIAELTIKVQELAARIPEPVTQVTAELSTTGLWDGYWAGSLNGEVSCCKAAKEKVKPATFITRMRRFFRDQLTTTARTAESMGLDEAQRVASDAKWQEQLQELVRGPMEQLLGRGLEAGNRQVGLGFDVQNPAVQEFVDRYTVRLASQVAGSTEVLLARLFDEKLKQGATVQDIAQGIRTLDAAVSPYRAEMIARTESARAYVAGETESWRASGQVVAKEWLLAPDACEFCQAVAKEYEKKSVGLDDQFYPVGHVLTGVDGGRMKLDYETVRGPPLHPHCRCDLLPVLSDE